MAALSSWPLQEFPKRHAECTSRRRRRSSALTPRNPNDKPTQASSAMQGEKKKKEKGPMTSSPVVMVRVPMPQSALLCSAPRPTMRRSPARAVGAPILVGRRSSSAQEGNTSPRNVQAAPCTTRDPMPHHKLVTPTVHPSPILFMSASNLLLAIFLPPPPEALCSSGS